MTRRHVLAAAILVIATGVSCSKEQPQQFDDARLITEAYYGRLGLQMASFAP
jgi:hypothetical protein